MRKIKPWVKSISWLAFLGSYTDTRAMRESDLYKINPYIVIDWFLQQLTRSLNFIVFFAYTPISAWFDTDKISVMNYSSWINYNLIVNKFDRDIF